MVMHYAADDASHSLEPARATPASPKVEDPHEAGAPPAIENDEGYTPEASTADGEHGQTREVDDGHERDERLDAAGVDGWVGDWVCTYSPPFLVGRCSLFVRPGHLRISKIGGMEKGRNRGQLQPHQVGITRE